MITQDKCSCNLVIDITCTPPPEKHAHHLKNVYLGSTFTDSFQMEINESIATKGSTAAFRWTTTSAHGDQDFILFFQGD